MNIRMHQTLRGVLFYNETNESFTKSNIFKFIWNGKSNKIQRKILISGYKDGVLKLTDGNMFLNS